MARKSRDERRAQRAELNEQAAKLAETMTGRELAGAFLRSTTVKVTMLVAGAAIAVPVSLLVAHAVGAPTGPATASGPAVAGPGGPQPSAHYAEAPRGALSCAAVTSNLRRSAQNPALKNVEVAGLHATQKVRQGTHDMVLLTAQVTNHSASDQAITFRACAPHGSQPLTYGAHLTPADGGMIVGDGKGGVTLAAKSTSTLYIWVDVAPGTSTKEFFLQGALNVKAGTPPSYGVLGAQRPAVSRPSASSPAPSSVGPSSTRLPNHRTYTLRHVSKAPDRGTGGVN